MGRLVFFLWSDLLIFSCVSQCSRQRTSAPRTESLSVNQWSIAERKNKQDVEDTFVTTPLKCSRCSFKVLEKSKIKASANL